MTAVASSPSIRPWTVALALAAVVALGFGCGRLGGARPSGSGLNLLLVTLDTTRADRLGCYGHRAARTPRLDRLAAEGVRFETALADAPITLPSHASIFTGLHPFEHGVRNNGNFSLPDRFPTLATVLRERGYRTAAFVSSFILDRRYGLARGFEVYDDRMSEEGRAESAPEAERRGDLTAGALGRWLAARAAGPNEPPFFAWLHLYDPHEPYRPPSPFREQFAADPYDGEIAFADATVGTVLDALDARGLLARTLVAVVADHGESLGEHGEETHSMFLYESTLRVPLILWRPGVLPSGRVVRAPVRTVDLAPTLLDVLGAPALGAPHARSLRAVVDGGAGGAPVAAYAETYVPRLYMGGAALRMLRDDRYKLIAAPRPELYDLAADPGETRNRFAEEPRIAGALQRGLEELLSGAGDAMSVVAVDSEAAEKLNALGYVGAGAEAPSLDRAGEGKDPKDLIAVFNRLRRANDALRDRRFGEALPILDAALAEDPQNAFARMLRGNARLGLGQYGPALGEFRAYLALAPRSAQAHQWLAVCHLKLGDRPRARAAFERALALQPGYDDAVEGLRQARG